MTYLNIVQALNSRYMFLIGRLEGMDTRVMHLTNFEVTLSYALGNDMLWTEPDYLRIEGEFPLPTDPFAQLPYEEFRARMVLYEGVMKAHHLLGTAEAAPPVSGINKYLRQEEGA